MDLKMYIGSRYSGKGLVVLKRIIMLPLQHSFMKCYIYYVFSSKFIFVIIVIILIDFTFLFNFWFRHWSLKIRDSLIWLFKKKNKSWHRSFLEGYLSYWLFMKKLIFSPLRRRLVFREILTLILYIYTHTHT
jgi:hypothetical protein